jgi:1-acyl-sn-glycerol-3-phosphate acyltransferase
VINHINFLEVPLLYIWFLPRKITALVKVETWDHPVFKHLAEMWGGIPVNRNIADTRAIRLGMEALRRKKILVIAPEGTRSRNGRLQQGRAGALIMAMKGPVPISPVAPWGGENFFRNLARMRKTRITIRSGEPFFVDQEDAREIRKNRQETADALMHRIADLLPQAYRGVYNNGVPEAGNAFLRPVI